MVVFVNKYIPELRNLIHYRIIYSNFNEKSKSKNLRS
jgi:oligoribonuclease (3'-5' exoribonuclease)